jgi:hypothetical protein
MDQQRWLLNAIPHPNLNLTTIRCLFRIGTSLHKVTDHNPISRFKEVQSVRFTDPKMTGHDENGCIELNMRRQDLHVYLLKTKFMI